MVDIAGLTLPHLSPHDRRCRLLSAHLQQSRKGSSMLAQTPIAELWPPEFYGLDRVAVFRSLSSEYQQATMHQINLGLIAETYFVEKMGMGYTAKMALLSKSLEERMIYSLFSSQEATHLAQVAAHFPGIEDQVSADDPFLDLLSELSASPDRALLLLVVQVVLEGWGLSHYRTLASGCTDPQVASIYTGFLADETNHHAMGLLSFPEMFVSRESYDAILDTLTAFLQMVQMGPQRVLAALERAHGYLSSPTKIQILTELETESQSRSRLVLIRSLLNRALTASASVHILEILESHGCFDPFPPHRCL